MLTNEDIKKLKQELATKEDLSKLVTQKEFENAVSKLLTREEFGDFKNEVKENFAALRESAQALYVAVDKLIKAIDDLRQEYVAITSQVNRHEKWLQQIAGKIGVKLEY